MQKDDIITRREREDNAKYSSTTINIKPSFQIDYDKYREDQLNTGVISALISGFNLINSWELERQGNKIDTITYVSAISAVHACTCSALTSAFIYRALTLSDPGKAVLWMKKHNFSAKMPIIKFIGGTMFYLISVVLVAWKGLSDEFEAKVASFAIGAISASVAFGICVFITVDHPGN